MHTRITLHKDTGCDFWISVLQSPLCSGKLLVVAVKIPVGSYFCDLFFTSEKYALVTGFNPKDQRLEKSARPHEFLLMLGQVIVLPCVRRECSKKMGSSTGSGERIDSPFIISPPLTKEKQYLSPLKRIGIH